jgi:hypothetical protein
MTKPVTWRPLKRAGRKPTKPPANAADRIRALSSDGFSVVGVAAGMGIAHATLYSWFEAHPELKAAFDEGREAERHTLHNKLYRLAVEGGHASAAMFLLKSRHGYREGDQNDQGGRVNVTIALPGAMSLQQFTSIGNGVSK